MQSFIQIQIWPVERFRPYARRLRKNDHAVDRMVAAIREFGFKIPLLARGSGELIDGHLRLKAAQKMGLTELPVLLCDEWTPTQVQAFRLLVNRSATWADWDLDSVTLELQELKELDFDLNLTGFEEVEIDKLLASALGDEEADVAPSKPAQPVSQSGDLWMLGGHRLLCGDATDAAAVSRLLGTAHPVLMITDPPYGVEYDPNWREQAGLGAQRQTGLVANDDRVDWSAAYKLFPGAVVYVWHAGVHAAALARSLEAADFGIRSQIIWAKQHFALSRGHCHWQHEPCWYAVREGAQAHWCGDRRQSTLWQVANLNPFGGNEPEEAATGHGTQKPLELMRRPMLNHTRQGEIIYDPFLGSGTTLMAAEQTGRLCYGLEIDPGYVDVIVERWQQLTGQEAVLAGDGRSFAAVRSERTGHSAAAVPDHYECEMGMAGQYINTHNDWCPEGPSHRFVLHLNRGWKSTQGGYLTLLPHPGKDSGRAVKQYAPKHGTGLGFKISRISHHAVTRVERGNRYSLVFSFKELNARPRSGARECIRRTLAQGEVG